MPTRALPSLTVSSFIREETKIDFQKRCGYWYFSMLRLTQNDWRKELKKKLFIFLLLLGYMIITLSLFL